MFAWFNYKILIRKYINLSSIIIFVGGLLIVWNSVLSLYDNSIDIDNSKLVEFTVLEKRTTSFFETINTVVVNNNLWEVSDSRLIIGTQYQAEVDIEKIYSAKSDNSFEVFQRSHGLLGELKVRDTLLVNSSCDLLCKFLKFVDTNQSNAKYRALQFSCHEIYPFVENLYYSSVSCEDVGSLITGLVYGDISGMSREVKDAVRKFGLSHLVAVSGFQVVLVAGFIEVLFRKIKLNLHWRIVLSILALCVLVVFAGAQPPILRSFLSIVILYLARILGRRCTQLRALIYSSFILLLFNPLYLFSISFQLSFLATLALLFTSFKKPIYNFIMAPVNAFFYTLPIIVGFAGAVSPIGIVTNILVAPLVSFVTYFSVAGFIPYVGDFALAVVNVALLLFLNLIVDFSSSINLIRISPFSWSEMLIYYCLLILFTKLLVIVLRKKI